MFGSELWFNLPQYTVASYMRTYVATTMKIFHAIMMYIGKTEMVNLTEYFWHVIINLLAV